MARELLTLVREAVRGHIQPMKKNRKNPSIFNPSGTESVSSILHGIKAEFEVAMGSPERVRSACLELRKWMGTSPNKLDPDLLLDLLPLLGRRMGPIVVPLFELLEDVSASAPDPWPFLAAMLGVKEENLVYRALDRTLNLAISGVLTVGRDVAGFFAESVEADKGPFKRPECLSIVGEIMGRMSQPALPDRYDTLEALYLQEEDDKLRRLAARIMDLKAAPVSHPLAEQVMGQEAHGFVAPYLDYTRATHLDLLHLISARGEPRPWLSALQKAEALCGKRLLQEVIARLGWAHVNLGLEVHQYVGVRIGSSFPLMVSPSEAVLFETFKDMRRCDECYLFVAHGGVHADSPQPSGADDAVARFRRYNLAHAVILADLVNLGPLTRERIWKILDWMDRLVFDFAGLFSAHTEECAVLPRIYQELRGRVVFELEKSHEASHFSPEIYRLMLTFEDPKSLGEVRTLHGLKRYLHQRGLRLGFRLMGTGQATDRRVSVVIASTKKILRVSQCIRYVDFDQRKDAANQPQIPYPVSVVVDAYSRQILHGQESFPETRVFCYGNEVHYYLSFKNHPAFIRIDFSPPLQGGIIDLEYYGVSKYEIDSHPNPSLDAVQVFFRQLEFDVQVKDTRIHARYDKERTLDLGELCDKAEALFRLAPYFMEIDWVIGSLNLPDVSRRIVAEAWARFFMGWGVLPLNRFLTRDRQGILTAIERGPAGDREIAWSGEAPYGDCFSEPLPEDLFLKFRPFLSEMGLDTTPLSDRHVGLKTGQIRIENLVLKPLRRAVATGQVLETTAGFHRASTDLFRLEHEAERFAAILGSDDRVILSAAILARIVAPMEQTLRFQTTGSLNGYDVQWAPLPLWAETLRLYALRDSGGMIRLALFTYGDTLSLRREDPSMPWQSNGSVDAAALAKLLRLINYPVPDLASVSKEDSENPDTIRSLFSRENPAPRLRPFPGERVLEGQKASPGRAVGPVIFGTGESAPQDLEGKLLVASSLRPEDYPFLYKSAGVISTGGGILSHAGITAMQLGKPALIVSGKWQRSPDEAVTLVYHSLVYQEKSKDIPGFHLKIRSDMHEQEHLLRQGDVVILDSEAGALRMLGQDREVLQFHEDFRHFCEAGRRLSVTGDEKKILVLRGRRLRARHQIEKLLARLTDPVLARHAAHELMMSEFLSGTDGSRGEKARLLSMLLNNPVVAAPSRDYLLDIFHGLSLRHKRRVEESFHLIQSSKDLYEILLLRLQILRLRKTVEGLLASLRDCGFGAISVDASMEMDLDRPVRQRLQLLRDELAQDVHAAVASAPLHPGIRHLVRQMERLDLVLGAPIEFRKELDRLNDRIARQEKTATEAFESRCILKSEDGGFELFPLMGWKGANLAEAERLLGRGLVPPWFAVTHGAFQEVMDSSVKRTPDYWDETGSAQTLRAAIHTILASDDPDNAKKSQKIRQIWEDVTLSPELTDEVLTAYRQMDQGIADDAAKTEDLSEPFVAIRSSAFEEDTELAARAGEFDTFLFIRGEGPVLDHLKRAWSGLWTERAIHNRSVSGTGGDEPGGGVLIQRIARSRVSGVLQTVNLGEGNLREMVINAGWGLGEGIVSGTIAADLIVVAKEGMDQEFPLRFRYMTGDKEEQMVFNAQTGLGTVRTKTLYHQRLRPAMEYNELCDLVRTAARLEQAYGYPLNMEFCIEGAKLWILQVRPIATFPAVLQETLKRYPLEKY